MSRQKKRERNICIIKHCRSYREAGMWPEPLTFHEFPADLARRKQWLQVGKKPHKYYSYVSLLSWSHLFPRYWEEKIGYLETRLNYVVLISPRKATESAKQ